MNDNQQLQELKQQFHPYVPMLTLLSSALGAAVPLYILSFQRRGGITDDDIARVQSYLEDLTAHGDDLYFRSRKRGETAHRFDQVAEIIAVISFSLGGITVFGLHFETRPWRAQTQHTSFLKHRRIGLRSVQRHMWWGCILNRSNLFFCGVIGTIYEITHFTL
ncbi:hypothetical protein ccbrp13_20120 [Ktedonobacteria bacterium brp13]|nr:hypothetical protein ccbrp13_20120 [Ktedonobacteria bacterium brp13]